MELMLSDIAARLGVPAPGSDRRITTLLTDSRSLEKPDTTLFFAIPTVGNDGHRYIPRLYAAGVRSFVVNSIPESLREARDIEWLVVSDTVAALQKTAARSDDFHGTILAVTGSRGKTTLKEWIFQLMEPLEDISRSPRSYNSRIGVPLSMWGIRSSASLAVIEAGISRRGEMKVLADCIHPDIVILTNLGTPHADGFASMEEKAEEKVILAEKAGVVIYSKDDSILARAVERAVDKPRLLSWSAKGEKADIEISLSSRDKDGTSISWKYKDRQGEFRVPFSADADIQNAIHALAFMIIRGVDGDVIRNRFAALHRIRTGINFWS